MKKNIEALQTFFRFVDEDGQDYQPPYFPPPQFEQGQYQFHAASGNGDGQFTQQQIIINEDGQQILEDDGNNGANGQTRIIVGNSDNYIVTQDGLALQSVDGQQVIMMNEVGFGGNMYPNNDNCLKLLENKMIQFLIVTPIIVTPLIVTPLTVTPLIVTPLIVTFGDFLPNFQKRRLKTVLNPKIPPNCYHF